MPLSADADVDDLAHLAILALRARNFNLIGVCFGLVAVSKLIAGDDQIARLMLASYLREIAAELEPDAAVTVRWQ